MQITHTPTDTSIGRFHKHTFIYVCVHTEKINCSTELIDQVKLLGGELLQTTYSRQDGKDRANFEFLLNPFVRFTDLTRLNILAEKMKLFIAIFDISGGEYLGDKNLTVLDYLETKPTDNVYAFQAKYPECNTPPNKDRPLVFRRYPSRFEEIDVGGQTVNFQTFNGVISSDLTINEISIREGVSFWVGLHHTGIWVYGNTGKELAKILIAVNFSNPYMMDVSKELIFQGSDHCDSDTRMRVEEINGRNTVYFIYRKLFKYVDVQMFRQIMTTIPYERFKPLLDAWRVPPTIAQPSDDELLALIKQI